MYVKVANFLVFGDCDIEYNTIRHILHANNYRPTTLNKIPSRIQISMHEPKIQPCPPLQTVPNKSQDTSVSRKGSLYKHVLLC